MTGAAAVLLPGLLAGAARALRSETPEELAGRIAGDLSRLTPADCRLPLARVLVLLSRELEAAAVEPAA